MANETLTSVFQDIADAIREKGVTGTMKPTEMAGKIGSIHNWGFGMYDRYDELVQMPLRCEGKKDGAFIRYATTGSMSVVPSLEYSTDLQTWSPLAYNTNYTLGSGGVVYLRGDNTRWADGTSAYTRIITDGAVALSGNIMSIVDKTNFATNNTIPSSNCFCRLFYSPNNYALINDGIVLPATNLKAGCYQEMFSGCKMMEVAPPLPATTLAGGCYYGMFSNCLNLHVSPELPATTLAEYCYSYMFSNCTSLNSLKTSYTGNFSGTGVPSNAFATWLSGVPSKGRLYYNGSDTTRGTSAIPTGWDVVKF